MENFEKWVSMYMQSYGGHLPISYSINTSMLCTVWFNKKFTIKRLITEFSIQFKSCVHFGTLLITDAPFITIIQNTNHHNNFLYCCRSICTIGNWSDTNAKNINEQLHIKIIQHNFIHFFLYIIIGWYFNYHMQRENLRKENFIYSVFHYWFSKVIKQTYYISWTPVITFINSSSRANIKPMLTSIYTNLHRKCSNKLSQICHYPKNRTSS